MSDLRAVIANTLEAEDRKRHYEMLEPLFEWSKGKDPWDVQVCAAILLMRAHLVVRMPGASPEEQEPEAHRVVQGIKRVLERYGRTKSEAEFYEKLKKPLIVEAWFGAGWGHGEAEVKDSAGDLYRIPEEVLRASSSVAG